MSEPHIYLKAGDHRVVRIGIRNDDGSARDLTGEMIEFRAAPSLSAGQATVAKIDGDGIEIVNAQNGLIDVVFTEEETRTLAGPLMFELRVTAVSGDGYTVDFSASGPPVWFGFLRIESSLVAA